MMTSGEPSWLLGRVYDRWKPGRLLGKEPRMGGQSTRYGMGDGRFWPL